jgi:hypothetical protein
VQSLAFFVEIGTLVAGSLGRDLHRFLETSRIIGFMPLGHVLSELAEQNLSGVHSVPVDWVVLPGILRLIQQEEAKT